MEYRGVAVAGARSPQAVVDHVVSLLNEVIRSRELAALGESIPMSQQRLETIREGENPDLSMREVAAILGVREDAPEGVVVREEFRDSLVVWMSEAVLDVEAVAASVGGTDPATLRDRIDGIEPFALQEYAAVVAVVETGRD